MERASGGPAANEDPGTPRWVKVLGVVVVAVLVLALAVALTMGDDHGPDRHTGRDGVDDPPPTASAEPGHDRPGVAAPIAIG